MPVLFLLDGIIFAILSTQHSLSLECPFMSVNLDLLYPSNGCIIKKDCTFQNSDGDLFILPHPPNLVVPHQDVESLSPYPEPGWSSMTASIHQKWGHMTSKRDHKRWHGFCLALPWDTPPGKPATTFWGSPSHIREVVCRSSSQQPQPRSQATASVNCQPCGESSDDSSIQAVAADAKKNRNGCPHRALPKSQICEKNACGLL